jgi:hypothetical protein
MINDRRYIVRDTMFLTFTALLRLLLPFIVKHYNFRLWGFFHLIGFRCRARRDEGKYVAGIGPGDPEGASLSSTMPAHSLRARIEILKTA